MAKRKLDRDELIAKISKLIAVEMDSSVFGSAGGGSGYDCKSHTFNCGNEYNCTQSVSCSHNYVSSLKEQGSDAFGKGLVDVQSDITEQIQGMLKRDLGKLIDPIITMGRHCDADSFSCNDEFSCSGGIGFKCNNKFTG